MSRFENDTAVRPEGDGVYAVRFDPAWWIVQGPNGGYVAAIVLRAMLAELDDATRPPRSLTVHFTAPPGEGPGRVEVRRERDGRSLSTLTARLTQGDRLLALAIGAFSADFPPAGEYDHVRAPAVPPPDVLPSRDGASPQLAFAENFDMRLAFGALPGARAEEAVAGGWMRLVDPHPLDAPAVTTFADAWWPSPFAMLDGPAFAPTVDLTVHFRRPLPPPDAGDDGWVLGRFRSRLSAHGFFEEDGELWTPGGDLVAESRQLALLVAPRPT